MAWSSGRGARTGWMVPRVGVGWQPPCSWVPRAASERLHLGGGAWEQPGRISGGTLCPVPAPPWPRGQPPGTVPGASSLHWYETDKLNDFWLFHPLQEGVQNQAVCWWRQWVLWVSSPLLPGCATLLGSSGAVCIPHRERTKGENHPIPVFRGRYLRADSSSVCISAAVFLFGFGFLGHTR